MIAQPRVALVSYSTKPRGGVVHTLSLAEAMHEQAMPVRVVSLGDPDVGFYRPVGAPYELVPAPAPADGLEERVFASIDALEKGLAQLADEVDIFHCQDCISARAAVRVRDAGADVLAVRTVHHVDDFTTSALVECQRRSIEDPDQVVVVSADWRARLKAEYGVDAVVIHNGVDPTRFPPLDPAQRAAVRGRAGLADRVVFLSVGGIEPRKGTTFLFQAVAMLAAQCDRPPALVVVGGHSFQDYAQYRKDALALLPALGLKLGRDVVLTGTVSDAELHGWYRGADALAFPSVKEGWGLAILEALSAELPVVCSDIPVLREYLTPDETAVLTRVGDPASLAAGMRRLMSDEQLRATLIHHGRSLVRAFTWQQAAQEHAKLYARLLRPSRFA
jgi:glycosyltransferase-like protein